jgi:molecular chaperone DnaK (HSP70)
MLPVGIITVGDTLTEIFPAGKPLPALFSETFATSSDGQTTVRLALGQRRSAGVEKVCDFTIEGIPPASRTTQRAIVTVEVSATKQLTAKVRVQSTGATTTYGPFSVE